MDIDRWLPEERRVGERQKCEIRGTNFQLQNK